MVICSSVLAVEMVNGQISDVLKLELVGCTDCLDIGSNMGKGAKDVSRVLGLNNWVNGGSVYCKYPGRNSLWGLEEWEGLIFIFNMLSFRYLLVSLIEVKHSSGDHL